MQNNATSSAADTANKTNLSGLDQFLTFILGKEVYGIDILRVQEIKGWEETTTLPNTPDYVKGVINLRGVVVPIVDLRERFNLSTANYDASTVVIIVRVNHQNLEKAIGLVVDGVSDVHDIDTGNLQPAPSFQKESIDTTYIRGLAMSGDNMVILLDVDDLINDGLLQNESNPTASLSNT